MYNLHHRDGFKIYNNNVAAAVNVTEFYTICMMIVIKYLC